MILRSTRTTRIVFWLISSVLLQLTTTQALDEAQANGCTFHQYYSCHEFADCIENPTEELEWTCVCQTNYEGDGLQGSNHTGCVRSIPDDPCRNTEECHTLAVCNENARCRCIPGYQGDGWLQCLDIDECLDDPCHAHASCENTDGSFECTCNMQQGYVGDGFNCQHECTTNSDCKEHYRCQSLVCVCDYGYQEVNGDCYDINECDNDPCHQNADCFNSDGSFECICKNGYTGDGIDCEDMPKTCHDIKLADPSAKNGEYLIDPDGVGPLEPVLVECEFRPTFGITIFLTERSKPKRVTNNVPTYDVTYTQSLEDIRAVIGESNYCYQSMRYDGYLGALLMDGDDWWVNGNGEKEVNWGGASEYGKCACGQLGYCTDRSAPCYNSGSDTRQIDMGNVIDKSKLPILSVVSKPGPSPAKAWVTIGSVMCAPVTFDIPLTCDDAKFNPLYKIRKDGPVQIDVDGPSGSLEPILVHCDMESHRHVGITVVPVSITTPINVTTPGSNPVDYQVEDEALQELVEISLHCYQEAGYTCKNSRLMNNGDKRGWFSDLQGNEKNYWPGGLGREYECGCAITGTCQSADYGCNCDVADGEVRTDFGKVVDKEDLPIGSVTFLDVGSGKSGSYYVGPLMCSQQEFGECGPNIFPSCRCSFFAYLRYQIEPDH